MLDFWPKRRMIFSQLCKVCCVTTGLIKRASNDPYRQPRQLQDLWFHQRSSHQKFHSTAEYCSTLRIAALSMFFFPSLIIINYHDLFFSSVFIFYNFSILFTSHSQTSFQTSSGINVPDSGAGSRPPEFVHKSKGPTLTILINTQIHLYNTSDTIV